jgi:uncharacterized protein (TIGR02117 family)
MVTVWVIDHGWHTAIVTRRADVARALWPEVDEFPEARFLEIAWGDGEYYMASSPTTWMAVKAAFMTSRSVLHVVGFGDPIAAGVAESAVELRLTREGFDTMTRLVHEEYQRDGDGRPVRLGPGLYGTSRFYAARSRYHLFNTCNTWILRMLGAAGLAVTPTGVITAGEAMRQLRRVGEARPVGVEPPGR